jgi:hypothetical protein
VDDVALSRRVANDLPQDKFGPSAPGGHRNLDCAGTGSRRSDDDTLAAGLIAERLTRAGAEPGEEARRAIERFEAARDPSGF